MKTMFLEYGEFLVEIIAGTLFLSVIAFLWPIIQEKFCLIIQMLV